VLRDDESSHLDTATIQLVAIGLANRQIVDKEEGDEEEYSPDLGIDYDGVELGQ